MKAKKLVSCLVAVLLVGCVPIVSLHPLYTKETLTFNEKLLGTWIEKAETPEVTWELARLEEGAADRLPPDLRDQGAKCYRMNVTDEKGRRGSFVACLVKLGDRLFFDILPDKFPAGEQDPESMKLPYNAFFFLRVHTFVRVEVGEEQLKFRLTNDEKFHELLKAEPKAVPCQTVDDQTVLTASTAELQAFVTKYANDERLFPSDLVLVRKSQ